MALPPNWTRYTTDEGKEYFHNAVTNTTQWDQPKFDDQAQTSEVYQYRPTTGDLESNAQLPTASKTVAMSQEPAGKALGGKVPSVDMESGKAGGAFGTGFGGNIVGGMLAAATEDDNGEKVSGMCGNLLSYLQTFFEVESDDVIKRVRMAMMPFKNSGDTNDFRERPDFWGPFWIATTIVLLLAATGNFASLLEMPDRSGFKANYGLVGLAAGLVYGCLVGVPLVLRIGLWLSGLAPETINFRQMICVYGYSLTPLIPVSLACSLPVGIIRWLLVALGFVTSMVFLKKHLLMDLEIEAPSLKTKMTGLFAVAQASIFIVYRLRFF